MRRLSVLTIVAAMAMATLVVGMGVRATTALFADQETTTASTATAGCFVNDAAAPAITGSIVSKTTPYIGGFIKQGAAYYVYANVGGGATRVTADVRPLTAGQFLAPLVAGAYSVGGVAYNWRTASLTAGSPLAEGAYTYSVSAANAALQCRTTSSTVTVDNTRPAATDVQPVNGGAGPVGQPNLGDTITFTFSEVIDPETILAGWTGASTNVVVRIVNSTTNDLLRVRDAADSFQLPFGTVTLGGDYVTALARFGATGTPSTMVQSGTTITVTLGTLAGTTILVPGNATASWNPANTPTDAAANALTAANPTEGGVADPNF